MFPANNLPTKPLVESSAMILREVGQTYLEIPIGTCPIWPKILDGHGVSQVFTFAHFRETAAAAFTVFNTQELLLKNV